MKKIYAEIIFVLPEVVNATAVLCGNELKAFFTTGMQHTWTFKTHVNLPKLPTSRENICLLSDEALAKVLAEGEGDERFDTDEKVKEAFSFTAYCHSGKQWWLELVQEHGPELPYEAMDHHRFILSQLVRFGVMDKLTKAK